MQLLSKLKSLILICIIATFIACGSDGDKGGDNPPPDKKNEQPAPHGNDKGEQPAPDGNDEGGQPAPDGNGEGEQTGNQLSWMKGTIVFEKVDDGIDLKHQGIYEYHIDQNRLLLYADGVRPRRHPSGEKTVLLQRCAGPSNFNLAIGDRNGLLTPITNCADTFTFSDYTVRSYSGITIETAAISPDQNKVLMILNDNYADANLNYYNYYIGGVIDINSGSFQYEERIRDAAWFPDGGLVMSTMDHRIKVLDANMETETYIDQNQFNASIQDLAVHPSGEFFLFIYNGQVWRMNKDGSGVEMVLKDQWFLRSPAWSPDGDAFAVLARDDHSVYQFKSFILYANIETREYIRTDIDLGFMNTPWPPLSWAP